MPDKSLATLLVLLGPIIVWWGATRAWMRIPLAVKRVVVGLIYRLASLLPLGESQKQRYKVYSSEVFSRGLGLRPPLFDVKIDRRIVSELDNGQKLTGTLYSPVTENNSKADTLPVAPVVVIRTPYTRIIW
jgi:hypothetical protein